MKRFARIVPILACVAYVPTTSLASDLEDIVLAVTAISVNNSVTSTVSGKATWDGGDQLRIRGQLRVRGDNCTPGAAYANMDSVIVILMAKDPGLGGSGYGYCVAPHSRVAFAPGTDSQGNFDVTIRGFGVGWVTGSGADLLGADIRLLFKDSAPAPNDRVNLYCGMASKWPNWFPCDNAPDIYGTLASPDLTGTDGFVDAGDFASFVNNFYGTPITANSGWQADFNHDGYCDFSDLSYLGGRMGRPGACAYPKPGEVEYAMDVHNLQLDIVIATLVELHRTSADVLRAWDEMSLSYDHDAASDVLAGRPVRVTSSQPWSAVKVLYRDPR